MRLLLDTHVWLWSLLEPQRLGSRAKRALESPDNELWLSPISVWELTILCAKGRVKLDGDPDDWVARALGAASMNEASITSEVALETQRVKLPHHDPADRFLAATARVFDLTLVTADEALLRARGVPTLSARK